MAGTTHPAVPATPCYAEPDLLGGLQSIDNLQSCLSLTAQSNLRLRGGAGGTAGQKKSGGSRKKRLKSTTTDEAQQEPDTSVKLSGKPPNEAQKSKQSPLPSYQFAVNDRIEVSASGQGSIACASKHVQDQHLRCAVMLTTKTNFNRLMTLRTHIELSACCIHMSTISVYAERRSFDVLHNKLSLCIAGIW